MGKKWEPKAGRSTVLSRIPKSGGFDDPKQFKLDLTAGQSVVLRFISLADEDVIVTPTLKCKVDLKGVLKEFEVPDPGSPDNEDILDDDGNPMSEGKQGARVRAAVFVRYILQPKKKGTKERKISEEVGELRYLQYGALIANALVALQEDENEDGYAYENTPDYDISITRNPDKNDVRNYWIVKPVKNAFFDVPLAKALSEDKTENKALYAMICDEMDDLVTHMQKVAEDEVKVDAVKKKFARYRDEDNDDDDDNRGKKKVTKPSRKRDDDEDEDEDEAPKKKKPVDDDEEDDDDAPPPKKSFNKEEPAAKKKKPVDDDEDEDDDDDAPPAKKSSKKEEPVAKKKKPVDDDDEDDDDDDDAPPSRFSKAKRR